MGRSFIYVMRPVTARGLLHEVALHETATGGTRSSVHVLPVLPVPQPAAPPRRRGILSGLVVMAVGLTFILQAVGVPGASAYARVTGASYASFLVSFAAQIESCGQSITTGMADGARNVPYLVRGFAARRDVASRSTAPGTTSTSACVRTTTVSTPGRSARRRQRDATRSSRSTAR